MVSLELMKKRHFNEVLELAYAIDNAQSIDELMKIGDSLYCQGIVLKAKINYK